MRNLTILASAILATTLFTACADKTPPDDDFSSFAGADTKSDSFSYRMTIIGNLTYGQTSAAATYTSSPRYRAYTFTGQPGDNVDVWVRSVSGDAVAWVLDHSFNVVGSNDDASDDTLDSHITVSLPTTATNNNYYIVYRDYSGAKGKFTVELNGTPGYSIACHHDSDCVAVPLGGCCPHGYKFAVNKGSVTSYENDTKCETVGEICPLYVVDDLRVAKCDVATDTCEMVQPPM